MNIQLNFRHQSDGDTNPNLVVFSKNVASPSNHSVAWIVIPDCRPGASYTFAFPPEIFLAGRDHLGNVSHPTQVRNGQRWMLASSSSGVEMSMIREDNENRDQLELLNGFKKGKMDALVYKDGKLFAEEQDVIPGTAVIFEFKPTIWVGVVSDVDEGDIIDDAMVDFAAEIPLTGTDGVNIVLTGGGPGLHYKPFKFTPELRE